VRALNDCDEGSGEYIRPTLEMVLDLVSSGCIDLSVCEEEVENNYDALILRFLEGDVPMAMGSGDVVSGCAKREGLSEAFTANPFSYHFYPIPLDEEGGTFLCSPSIEFAVNKDGGDVAMANEFMRFLFRTDQLEKLSQVKGLISSTGTFSEESLYAPFGALDASRKVFSEKVGLGDEAVMQVRLAAYAVGSEGMSIDDAVAAYGTFEK